MQTLIWNEYYFHLSWSKERLAIHTIKDSLLVIGRIYTIYPLLLAITLFMGRRSIAQLPIFDFLIFLSLGSVVGADIADPKVEHIHTAVSIIFIGIMQKLFSYLLIKSRKFEKLVTLEPVIVLKDGVFLRSNLKKLQYSINDILRMLREQGIFDPSQVDLGVLEGDGALSVLKKADQQVTTSAMLGITNKTLGIAFPVIKEGIIQLPVLEAIHVHAAWLEDELKRLKLNKEDIFLGIINENKELIVTSYGPEADYTAHIF